jgi:hypothetical protein
MPRAACLVALMLIAGPAMAEPFTFAALGDMPYGKPKKVWPRYEVLIDRVNAAAPALVIHVGDTKSGSTKCNDKMLDQQLVYLNSFAAPTLYTPGDNEWTDCHRKKAGRFDPEERLARIRATYFADPGVSFGRAPIPVTSQAVAGYPENAWAMHRGVMFATLHVVGSNNNFNPSDKAAVAEFRAREAAALQWIANSFAAAGRSEAAVIAIHADMFRDAKTADKAGWPRKSGYARIAPAFRDAAAAFGKPVLLIFGDSHEHRVFQPFPRSAPNVTAMEVYGDEDMHAVLVDVDPAAPAPFRFRTLLNPG